MINFNTFLTIYYETIIGQIVLAFILYKYAINLCFIEKYFKMTIQVNLLNLIYYIYRLLYVKEYIVYEISKYYFSILVNLNYVITLGYIIYRFFYYERDFFLYYDTIILHLYNCVNILIETSYILEDINTYQYYIESNLILSLIIFISWYPLLIIYKRWNYDLNLTTIFGKLCILSIYVFYNIIIYVNNKKLNII
jgi:hypothetical protein